MGGIVGFGVLIYIIGMLIIGFWASKRVHNLADFLVAGRRIPYPLAVATLLATWYGAGSCMGASGTAYSEGLLGVVSDPFAAGTSLILAGLFYVAFLRRLQLLTITDIFGKYYSKNAEIAASVLMVPVYIGWLGSQMVALGYIVHLLTGIDPLIGITIGGVVVLVYTFAGGMWAVAVTDFVQIIVLIIGLLVILPSVLAEVGGLSSLFSQTPPEMLKFFPTGEGYHGWVGYIGQWTLMGLGCIVGQDLIQRSLSSKNERVARTSAVTAGIMYIALGAIPIILGFAGRIIFPDLSDPEHIMPTLAMKFLSPVMVMLFIGALISAIMSSADSSLLAATSLTTNNIILRLFPTIKEERVLPLARIITVIMAILSMGVALYVKQIYDLMVNSWATLFVGIFVPVTAALYWKKANVWAAWASMIFGTGTWIVYIIVKTGTLQDVSDSIFYEAAAYGGLVSFVSYVVTTLARYNKIPDIELASSIPEQV
ncbi:MAG: sodium:solute symporter family protein [Candidatus Omnitrophica bacterium]|nr:sodium:solute symporter family protein [Candidatus Omnitrophota bacterium]